MSNLQIGLAVAGGLVLAAVVAHSAWTSRKNLPRQPEDVSAEPPERRDPVLDESALNLPQPEKKPTLDPLIDVIAPIALETPLSGEAALAAMPVSWRVGSKLYAVEGFNEHTRDWEMPTPGVRYALIQAGVQLANRTGPLNEIEYSEFVVKTQAFADAVEGTPDFPEMRDEVARARELDQFASSHDAQLSFTLRATQSAWSPGYVSQNAARLGFVAGVIPGRWVLPASKLGMPPVLVLAFDSHAALAEDPTQSAIREVTLTLDVPQVDRSERAFVRMRHVAKELCANMEGMLTDDNGQSLSSDTLDLIGSELEMLCDTLEQRELSVGSNLARRLFS